MYHRWSPGFWMDLLQGRPEPHGAIAHRQARSEREAPVFQVPQPVEPGLRGLAQPVADGDPLLGPVPSAVTPIMTNRHSFRSSLPRGGQVTVAHHGSPPVKQRHRCKLPHRHPQLAHFHPALSPARLVPLIVASPMAHLTACCCVGLDCRIVSNGAPPSNLYQPSLIHRIRAYLFFSRQAPCYLDNGHNLLL